jgi:hypothetical protein
MKRFKKLIILCAALNLGTTAIAGPFRTVVIPGSPQSVDFTLAIPAGKALGVVNLISDDNGFLSATVNGQTMQVLKTVSTVTASTVSAKEVIIDGPATITIDAPNALSVFFTYRLFGN